MAEIVLGIGSSHGPLLSMPPEQWDLRAKADRENKKHWFRGKTYDFETLLKERAPGFADQVTVEVRRERFQQCRRAMEVLGKKFKETAPDAVVILEVFSKKTRQTPRTIIEVCKRRLRDYDHLTSEREREE